MNSVVSYKHFSPITQQLEPCVGPTKCAYNKQKGAPNISHETYYGGEKVSDSFIEEYKEIIHRLQRFLDSEKKAVDYFNLFGTVNENELPEVDYTHNLPLELRPKELYHATFKKHVPSIESEGLGSPNVEIIKNWDFSKIGTYLTSDKYMAEAFCEAAEEVDDETYDSGIVLYKVNTANIKSLKIDTNNDTKCYVTDDILHVGEDLTEL